jgi:hypothetical protein
MMMPDPARLMLTVRLARVLRVKAGEGRSPGQKASQWIVDLEDLDSGAIVVGALVVGSRRPIATSKTRASIGVYTALAGNSAKCVFWALTWPSCSKRDIASHDLLDEHETITFHIERGARSGNTAYTIKKPDLDRSDDNEFEAGQVYQRDYMQERYLQILADKEGRGVSFEMLGGSRRMARAGTTDEGGKGDYVQIDAETSPNFAAWMTWVTSAITALSGVSQGGGGPIPPAVIPPFPTLGPDGSPAGDPVPAVDGAEPGPPPVGASVVGAIVTGSTSTRGR